MDWFNLIKAPEFPDNSKEKPPSMTTGKRFEYKKDKNNPRFSRYADSTNTDVNNVEFDGTRSNYQDTYTGKDLGPENPSGHLKFYGWKAAMHHFKEYKAANGRDYYNDISAILTKYSKTRSVQPHRNVMEEHISNYWEEHLASLRELYTKMDALAQRVELDYGSDEGYLKPKDSQYVVNQIKEIEEHDDKALLGQNYE